MQTQQKTQNSWEEVELSLDEEFNKPVIDQESSESQDEEDLKAAEQEQSEELKSSIQTKPLIKSKNYTRKESTLYTAISMGAGVLVVVSMYVALVFI